MEEKNFVICDSEREYGIRFMERVQAHAEFYVQVRWAFFCRRGSGVFEKTENLYLVDRRDISCKRAREDCL